MEETNMVPTDKIKQSIAECSPSKCIIKENSTENDLLCCRKCKRQVHYCCSELPDYQIQLCLTFKARSFQCRNCVNISKNLSDRIDLNKETKIVELRKEIKACENIINAQDIKIKTLPKEKDGTSKVVKDMMMNLEKSMDQRMSRLEKKIDDVVGKPVEKTTYAQVAKKYMDEQSKEIKNIIRKGKEEDLWIKSTACNIIIHGVEEWMDDDEIGGMSDKDYVEKIVLKEMGLNFEIARIHRIGVLTKEREDNEKYRPMKVQLKSEDDKIKVLKGLHKLKIDQIRITEDLSPSERQQVKEWWKKADEKNLQNKDQTIRWKVRGSPRSGLYLKKFVIKSGLKRP